MGEGSCCVVPGRYTVRMKFLIACEFSGAVRDAITRTGNYAMSCDLEESETPGPHYCGDVRDLLDEQWDALIAFPPCTYLANSGARWLYNQNGTPNAQRWINREIAVNFVKLLWASKIPKVAIENPMGALSTQWRKHDQVIQPYQFGHAEMKTTCIWLRGFNPLTPTKIVVPATKSRIHHMAPGPNRQRERSRTYSGIAEAMALQWTV